MHLGLLLIGGLSRRFLVSSERGAGTVIEARLALEGLG